MITDNANAEVRMNDTERVSIYIDGLNFYHNAIQGKDRRYYYPSLQFICKSMLAPLQLEEAINEIHYFSAKVSNTKSDPTKKRRQWNYINALQTQENIKFHPGKFRSKEGRATEKQTDVNITVQMLNDAWNDEYTHGILLSNDSDFVELVRTVREDRNKIVIVWNTNEKTRALTEHANDASIIQPEYIRQAPQIANKGFQREHNTPRAKPRRKKYSG